jgi:hypothetical protein
MLPDDLKPQISKYLSNCTVILPPLVFPALTFQVVDNVFLLIYCPAIQLPSLYLSLSWDLGQSYKMAVIYVFL